MERTIKRVGVYAYPPEALSQLLEAVWRGERNQYLECELISRHAGECPLWGAHVTLLDAITIVEEDFSAFQEGVREVLARHLPIAVGHPHLMERGNNVFLRWEDEEGMGKLKNLRVELAAAAHPFAVTERLDWEQINEVERLLNAYGIERAPAQSLRDGLDKLKSDMAERPPRLLYAPNVPLEWYAEARTKGPLTEGTMPFPLSPHISIASAVRTDAETGRSARDVGEYIKDNLPNNPEFKPLLGPEVTHVFKSAFFVEPLPPEKAVAVTVLDRITQAPRQERRQPWVPTQELVSPVSGTISDKVVFCFWTRWPLNYRRVTAGMSSEVARAVLDRCRDFARASLGGASDSALFLLKTTGKGANDPAALRAEEAAWREAAGADFEFQYLACSLPVCSGWDVCWHASRWWEKGDILAFPTMDFIDVMLADEYRITSLRGLDKGVRACLGAASAHFGDMLRIAEESRGLVIGGYRTCDHYAPEREDEKKRDRIRRGGLPAKDLLEAAFRCHAAGIFHDYKPFRELLSLYPDLRVRSEIIVIHRECWEKLLRARRLQIEPFEGTLQLILGALFEGCSVDQVDFGWLLEEGDKPDTTVVAQLKRGVQTIERLRQFWF
jgi:hypothetical protein